ncbi:hypothetical protein [Cylindrospermum sp. FACHB-282]|uniref:hypothetical protein n=1 Tax=Cylindrospermum sp. FACHB-282 TaxID=2692794 RepID=UPI001F54FE50|nr:hypothetical protein [Cylindrospermum sp. FACHB-282]
MANKVQRLIKRDSRGEQPKIVEELERRFNQASSKLEQVNTAALVDQFYSQEKIRGFTCEQIDYFCRIIPNLLLSFGLLGTFFGITVNLSALSQIINQTNASDVSNLVNELNKPLEGMSIAFTTSLIGIFLSAVLTVFNSIWNTSFAKYRLLSCLEDYLDNIYLPQVQGDTRLDKIVNKMVSQQDEFLTRFGDTVRDAVEKSIGNVAKQIADGNKEVTDLAKQVYERFTEAAGTISGAANTFSNSMTELNATSQIFKHSAEIFEKSQFSQQLSAATIDLARTQDKFSQSATSLAQTTELITTVLIEIQHCSQILINLAEDIKSVNQTSFQILDLHQTNQNYLGEIIPQLKQGSNSFQKAVNKLDKLEMRIVNKADSLNNVEVALTQLLESVKDYTKQVNVAIENLGDRFINNFSQQIDNNHQQFQTLITIFEQYSNNFSVKFDMIKLDLINFLEKNNVQLILEYQNGTNIIVQGINKQGDTNTRGLQMVIKNIQECNQHLNDTKNSINQLRQVMKLPE